MTQAVSEKQPKGSAARGWVIIGGAVLIVAWWIAFDPAPAANPSPASTPSAPAAAPQQSIWDKQGAEAAGGALMIRRAMRNPDSFQLSTVLDMPGPVYCYEYRAQNGFGGLNVDHGVLKGETLKFTGVPGFATIWNDDCVGKSGTDITSYVAQLVKMVAK